MPPHALLSLLIIAAALATPSSARDSSLFGGSSSSAPASGSPALFSGATYSWTPRSPLPTLASPGATSLFGGSPTHSSSPRSSIRSLEPPSPPRTFRAHLLYSAHTPSGWEYETTTKTVRWSPSFGVARLLESSDSSPNYLGYNIAAIAGVLSLLAIATVLIVVLAFAVSAASEHRAKAALMYRSLRRKYWSSSSKWTAVDLQEDL